VKRHHHYMSIYFEVANENPQLPSSIAKLANIQISRNLLIEAVNIPITIKRVSAYFSKAAYAAPADTTTATNNKGDVTLKQRMT